MPLDDQPTELKPTVPAKVAAALDASPRVVSNWRMGLRWFSNQCFILVGAAQSTWIMLDADQRAALPHNFIFWFTGAICAIGFIGRFYQQRRPPDDWPQRPPC